MMSIRHFVACALSSVKQRTRIHAGVLSLPFSSAGTARLMLCYVIVKTVV